MKIKLLCSRARMSSVLAISFALFLLGSAVPATAQTWSGPDGNGNISNANSGNVGIGTTSPGYALDVNGIVAARTRLWMSGLDLLVWGSAASGTNRVLTGTPNIESQASGGFEMGTSNAAPFVFYTSATERVRILSGGNVGVGTSSPGALLDVNIGTTYTADRGMRVTGSYPNIQLYSNYDTTDARNWAMINPWNHWGDLEFRVSNAKGGDPINNGTSVVVMSRTGNVGIGALTPGEKLDVVGNLSLSGGSKEIRFKNASGNAEQYVWHSTTSLGLGPGNADNSMFVTSSGKVGVGTTSPQYKLDVNGTINSNSTITGNSIVAKYQDVAEWVPSSEQLAVGTVVVLDSSKSNHVISSTQSYDTRVAGVISAQPGIALGEKGEGKVLVATTGRVKIKVDASKSPIRIGDLLVTSDVPGMAMKSEPTMIGKRQFHAPGTLIGKALEPLAKGSGEILVLLSLQ